MKQLFTTDEQKHISEKIESIENRSNAEVRVAVLNKEKSGEKKLSIEKLAEKYFFELGMDKTVERTGVLLLIHAKRHAFHLMGDKGIDTHIPQQAWNDYASNLGDFFKHDEFEKGVLDVLDKIAGILSEHFPKSDDDTNELSNKVEFL